MLPCHVAYACIVAVLAECFFIGDCVSRVAAVNTSAVILRKIQSDEAMYTNLVNDLVSATFRKRIPQEHHDAMRSEQRKVRDGVAPYSTADGRRSGSLDMIL
jgi:hypothetical protein